MKDLKKHLAKCEVKKEMNMQSIGDFTKEVQRRVSGEGTRGAPRKFTILSNFILDDDTLSCQEKMILWVLYRYDHGKGECWPAKETIQKNSGIGRDKINEVIKSLEKKKWIEILKGLRRSNTYRFLKK